MAVLQIDQKDFKKEVLENNSIVLVDFFAPWCGPCKMTSPIIDQLSEEEKNIKFVKIDVDKDGDLAGQYNVFSIPTFVIFKNGQIASQFTGAMSKEGFLAEFKKITE